MKKSAGYKRKKNAAPARIQSFIPHRTAHMKQSIGVSSISQLQSDTVIQPYSRFSPDQQKRNKSLAWKSPSRKALRVSDFGLLAAEEGDKGSNNKVWAIARKIRASEHILKGLGSAVKLESGTHTIRGKAPYLRGQGGQISLHEVQIKDRSGARTGRMKLAEECGHLSRQVLGLKKQNEKAVAVTGKGSSVRYSKGLGYRSAPGAAWLKDIYSRRFGNNPPKTKNDPRYKRFAQQYGLDQHAKPTVGQGLIISEQNKPSNTASNQNFHMAAVILRSKNDYITMESVVPNPRPATVTKEDNWYFRMYGTHRKSQTFHEEWGKTGKIGQNYTTMVFQPEKTIIGTIRSTRARAPLYVAGRVIAWLDKGTIIRTSRLAGEKRQIRVVSGVHKDKTGWIANWFFKSN